MKYLKKINESSNNKEITFVRGDDWEGIYLDGELLNEGHSVNVVSLLMKLGYTIKPGIYLKEYEWEAIGNSCPEKLEDIKTKLASKKYNL